MIAMHLSNFYGVDLNLLKLFAALLKTGSVTQSAKVLSIGQPAASHALKRLRETFDDELFVRTGDTMQPTAKAQTLAGPLVEALDQIESLLTDDAVFEPTTDEFSLTIGLSDYTEAVLLPKLISSTARNAPRMRLRIVQLQLNSALHLIDERKVDLAVGDLGPVENWHCKQLLFEDVRHCLFAKALVRTRTPITLKSYLKYRHIIRSLGARLSTDVDRSLGSDKRDIALTTPRFSNLPALVKSAPLIATLPGTLASIYKRDPELAASVLPFETPKIAVSMVWHRAQDKRPELAWLRQQLEDVSLRVDQA